MTDKNSKKDIPKILLVDDEINVLRAIERLFIDEDYEVFTATSGDKGLKIMENHEIAVVISDQRMPGMSGSEFLMHVKEKSPDCVRIVLTGHADIDSAIDAINKGGAHRYITKPWNNDDLIITVRSGIERYNLIKENRYLTELTKKQNEELKKWSSELELYVQEQTIELTRKNQELAELNKKVKKDFQNFIVTMSNLIELRDKSMASHSNNVSVLSREIAMLIGLNEKEIEIITIAGQLHDIGKIGIPDPILLKEIDSFNDFEFNEYKKHPIRGQSALDINENLREAGTLIRHHHEHFNGHGFPDGLKGSNIPLGSRIIGITDRIDRLMRTRTFEQTIEHIKNHAGKDFDPKLIDPTVDAATRIRDSIIQGDHDIEIECHPKDLISGMILSRDLISGTGMLLLSKGTIIDEKRMESIKRYYRLDPPLTGVFIWSSSKKRAL
ncbi:MAG: response regulator [Syntrophorhabdaceae bacterium]|nr:response regulator [Syntrophorhabdaceae bacterium]